MKKLAFILAAIMALFSCAEPLPSVFGSIGGTVQDSKTGEFIPGVTVTINPLGYSQVTNGDGAFQYDNLEESEYTLVFSKTGYETSKHKVTVKPGKVSSVQIVLSQGSAAVSVDPSILDFGTKTAELSLKLSSLSGNVPYKLAASNSWITLSKSSGTLNGDEYITVIVSRSGLSPASYEGYITVTSGAQEISVPVKMTVAASGVPVVTMESVSDVTSNGATLSGNLKVVGDSRVSQYGFCWSKTNASPGLSDRSNNLGDASDVKSFTADITGLDPQTKYYVRSYAVNSYGTSYSDEVLSFTTGGSSENEDGSGQGTLAVPQGLVSYYTFDDSDASDDTDFELDGVLIGDPAFVTETVNGEGKALFLNGTKGQFMSIPYNVFNNLTKISVSFWIKDFNSGIVFSAISDDYIRSDQPRLVADSDNKFRFYSGYDNYDVTPQFSYLYTSIQSGKWHHVAVTMDDDTRVIYIDGSRVDSNTASCLTNSWKCTKVHIGGDNNGKYKSGFTTMKIDNVRFYQRCISDAEVKEIYKSEKQ